MISGALAPSFSNSLLSSSLSLAPFSFFLCLFSLSLPTSPLFFPSFTPSQPLAGEWMYRLRNAITRAISSVRPVSRQQLPTPKQVPPARQFAAATTTTNNTNTTKDNNSNNNNDHSKNNNMANRADSIFELAKARRSYYPLSKELTISPERVQEIVKQGILHVPSSFNSQSNRAIVLFGADHEKLWDIATEAVKPFVPPEGWQSTANRMAMFKAAAGSVSILSLSLSLLLL